MGHRVDDSRLHASKLDSKLATSLSKHSDCLLYFLHAFSTDLTPVMSVGNRFNETKEENGERHRIQRENFLKNYPRELHKFGIYSFG
jgi:hypothetical protein